MTLVQVLQDAFTQVSYRHANRPGSVTLQFNNLVCTAKANQIYVLNTDKQPRVQTKYIYARTWFIALLMATHSIHLLQIIYKRIETTQHLASLPKTFLYVVLRRILVQSTKPLYGCLIGCKLPVNHHLVDALPVLLVFTGTHVRVQTLKGHTSHVDAAPHGNWKRRAMFSCIHCALETHLCS